MTIYRGLIPKKNASQQETSKRQQSTAAASLLLTALWGKTSNTNHFIATQDPRTSVFHSHPVADAAVGAKLAAEYSAKGLNVFHACSGFSTKDGRKKDNVVSIKGFWLDIDCGAEKAAAGKGYATQAEAFEALQKFCAGSNLPSPNFVIDSGNGIHVYWMMVKAIGVKLWLDSAEKLRAMTVVLGLKADPSRTADSASLMRTPGSVNHKGEKSLPVTVMGATAADIPVQSMLDAINAGFDKHCGKSGDAKPAISQIANDISCPFSQDEFDRLKSALTTLNPDCDEHTWKFHRLAVLTNLAKEHPDWADRLRSLACDWSSGELRGQASYAWTHPGNTNGLSGEQVFDQIWGRFLTNSYSGKQATVGTIYFHAREVGWTYQSAARNPLPIDQTKVVASKPANEGKQAAVTATKEASSIQTIQQQICLVKMDSKFWVFDLNNLTAKGANGLALKPEFFNQKDGSLLVQRALRAFGQNEGDATRNSRQFFTSPQTICYDGVEFNPSGHSANKLNLWIGPTLVPQQGGWILIRTFLLEVICNNDHDAFEYLINFLAHALQFPDEKPGVMIILIGGQGVGKGTLAKILRLIWSATYYHIHKVEDVTGSFNATLERAFIVFLDEALFVGDRKSSDSLKSLVTENVIQINEKYQPARQTRSYHRFFAATNAEHFKNTERDDRRDFVLKVSEAKKDDHVYWSALNSEIDHGGVAAMMHDLLAMDLTGFNVRAKPSTAALVDQKLLSLGAVERWWFNALSQGNVEGTDDWPDFISTAGLIAAVMEFSGGKIYRKPSPIEVIKTMKQLCPSATNKQQQESLGRHRGLALPSLEQARLEFDRYIGGAVAWESDEAS